MTIGVYEVFYSIRMALENEAPELTDVQMIYDGVKLSGREKPFAIVQYLTTNKTKLAAGQRTHEYAFRFQVGIHARSLGEQLQLEEKIDAILSNPEGIPLYNEEFKTTGETVLVDVSDFTPITNDDVSNKTNNHRGYFDVSVFLMRKFGNDGFSQ